MVGTGLYANEVLSGLGDYLDVKCRAIYAPEGNNHAGNYDSSDYGYEGGYDDWQGNGYGWETYTLTLAELQDVGNRYYTSYFTTDMGLVGSQGDGAIMVLPYALAELQELGATDFYQFGYGDLDSYMGQMITEAYNYASVRYDQDTYSDNSRYLTRIMKFWGNSGNTLNFTFLKMIIFLYVIFVGPVLYLVLKLAKKKELYWVLVPVTTLCTIGIVFLAGRGFKMVNTTVYSVLVENAEGRGEDTAYLYCYDASHREWDLKLADGYDFVSGFSDIYSYHSYNSSGDNYYFHAKKKGEELYFGIKPEKSFEDCFFVAKRGNTRDQASGKIVCDWIVTNAAAVTSYGYYGGIFGQVTNDTGEDFSYCAVIADESVYVYEGLQSGETLELDTANPVYSDSNSYNMANQYLYNCLDDSRKHWTGKQKAQLSALGVAIASLYSDQTKDKVIVIGVTENGEKAVDDRCYEVTYKCLYTME